MSFKIGDKVVCVDDTIKKDDGLNCIIHAMVIKGKIYTIRGFCPYGGILLYEVVGGLGARKKDEVGFNIRRFRKVEESFAEGVLENILKNTSVEELELIEEETLVNK